jgi:FixJ family two-component response regulator
VILDVVMPGLNGYDVYKLLTEVNQSVKIIFSSGFNDGDVDLLIKDENRPFVQKPYSLVSMSRVIADTLAGTHNDRVQASPN